MPVGLLTSSFPLSHMDSHSILHLQALDCWDMAESIDAAVTRKGTHVRIVSKYKEEKYKPGRA
jgi:hypothetical protein